MELYLEIDTKIDVLKKNIVLPGYAVPAAIEAGELDNHRIKSYRKLEHEVGYDDLISWITIISIHRPGFEVSYKTDFEMTFLGEVSKMFCSLFSNFFM